MSHCCDSQTAETDTANVDIKDCLAGANTLVTQAYFVSSAVCQTRQQLLDSSV